jgi:Domain of unknown function (DUF4296)
MKLLFFIIISVLLFSCSDNNLPRGILPQEKMELMLWEQMKADAFTKEFISKDSSKNLTLENIKLQQKLFAKYKIDKDEFYDSYEYYLKHDALMKDVLDSIVAKQTRIHQKEFEQKMSGRGVNNYEDIFKLKEMLKPKAAFKMQDSLKFNDVIKKPDFIKKIDSVNIIQSFRKKSRSKKFLTAEG